MERHSDRQTDR